MNTMTLHTHGFSAVVSIIDCNWPAAERNALNPHPSKTELNYSGLLDLEPNLFQKTVQYLNFSRFKLDNSASGFLGSYQ